MKTSEIKAVLDRIAPLSLQEDWDNSGMQIETGRGEINKILVALEITSDVIEEAITKKAQMIVTHHPLIFHPVKNICVDDVVGNYILRLIRAEIPVYSAHTCFDSSPGGNNDYLLHKLGIQYFFRLPVPGIDICDSHMARMGVYEAPMFFGSFCEKLNKVLGSESGLRIAGSPERLVQKIAVCTGAGGEFWEAALAAGADVFISGDIKHHEAQGAKESGLCIIDAGHYGTEHLFVHNMASQLRKKCGADVEIIESAVCQNPYNSVMQL